MVERARAARDAGLDSLTVGDHHAVGVPYYQNIPIMGRLVAEWGNGPFGCLFLLPMWNPVLVAEQVGTLASLAAGRFILQCAIGDGEPQFAAMGADIRRRVQLFEEGLEVVRTLLAGRPASSEIYGISGVRVAPMPAEPVEVWVGGTARAAVDRAARMGDAWYAGPQLRPEQAARLIDVYREACAKHARTPACIPIRRDVFVAADDAEASETLERTIASGYRGFHPSALVAGTVESAEARFAELRDLGYTDVIVRHMTDDHGKVLASIERLGRIRDRLAAA